MEEEKNQGETVSSNAVRKHRVLDTPFLGPLLLFIIGDLFYALVGAGLYNVLPAGVFYFVQAGLSFILFGLYTFWFRKEFRHGFYTKNLTDKWFWIIFVLLVLIDCGFCIYDMCTAQFVGLSIEGLGSALMAGLSEEILSRYILISTMMRRYKDKGNLWLVLLFTGITFGLSHFLNVTSLDNLAPTCLQVIVTIASGLAMGAIYLRTGNILLSVGWHFLHDVLTSMTKAVEGAATILPGMTVVDLVECILCVIVYVTFAIVLMKGQSEKIRTTWHELWPTQQ